MNFFSSSSNALDQKNAIVIRSRFFFTSFECRLSKLNTSLIVVVVTADVIGLLLLFFLQFFLIYLLLDFNFFLLHVSSSLLFLLFTAKCIAIFSSCSASFPAISYLFAELSH